MSEQAKLSNQFNEVEIAERALRRFGGKGAFSGKQRSVRAAGKASKTGEKHKTRNDRQALRVSLGDAALYRSPEISGRECTSLSSRGSIAGSIHDVCQAGKHRVGEPMAAQIVPNPLDRIELWAIGRQLQ